MIINNLASSVGCLSSSNRCCTIFSCSTPPIDRFRYKLIIFIIIYIRIVVVFFSSLKISIFILMRVLNVDDATATKIRWEPKEPRNFCAEAARISNGGRRWLLCMIFSSLAKGLSDSHVYERAKRERERDIESH